MDTQRAQAPIALEDAFEKLFAPSPIGMATSRLDDGRFIDANAPYCAILSTLVASVTHGLGMDSPPIPVK